MQSSLPCLIDTHTHLDDPKFEKDLEEVLRRAFENGVEALATVGTHPASWERALEICSQHTCIFPVLGYHPNYLNEVDEKTWPGLVDWLRAHPPKAIGEIGLDYYWKTVPRPIQERYFREQLRLARSMDLPIVIHCREAYPDCLKILREECSGGVPGVFHCFSSDWAAASEALELGLHLSFGGPLTYPKSVALRDAARQAPLARILVETDCPYLAPQARRGQRNEPSFVKFTAEKLAEVRGMGLAELALATTANARTLFRLG